MNSPPHLNQIQHKTFSIQCSCRVNENDENKRRWRQKRKKLLLWCLMLDALKESPTANRQRVLYYMYNWIYGNRGKTATKTLIPYFRPNKYTHYSVCMRRNIITKHSLLFLCLFLSLCIVYMLTCWIEKSRLSFAHSSLFVIIHSFVMIVLFSFPIAVQQSLCVRSFSLRFIFIILGLFFLYLLFDFAQTWYVCHMNMCVGSSSFVHCLSLNFAVDFFSVSLSALGSRHSSVLIIFLFEIEHWIMFIRNMTLLRLLNSWQN